MGKVQTFPKRANKNRKNRTISRREIDKLLTPPGQGEKNSPNYKNTHPKTDRYVGQPEYETKHDEKLCMNHLSRKERELLSKIFDPFSGLGAYNLVGVPINPTPVYPTEQ